MGTKFFDWRSLDIGKTAADHPAVGLVKVYDAAHPVADQDALLYGLKNGIRFHESHYNTIGQGWGDYFQNFGISCKKYHNKSIMFSYIDADFLSSPRGGSGEEKVGREERKNGGTAVLLPLTP